ncbi:MAG: four helix bundle protein [Patescibacteria group bacterium]|nr:four helix bundle protein [Patescibacteria group bacterium]
MDTLPNKRAAWIIADQLLRSAMSIGANLIEGSAASSRLEYKKFYETALKSANETKYWLSLLKDSGIANIKTADELLAEATEIANMLAAGVLKLKAKNF